MKKGETYIGLIEKVEFPNKGIINIDDNKIIVKNVIPGQKVRFKINKKRKNKLEGRLLEVVETSPLEEREKICQIFPECGGCMYQTMPYKYQLEMKENQILDLLKDFITENTKIHPIIGSPKEFCYRNKMEFSFGDEFKDGPLTVGLHKKGSTYDILNAFSCKLVHSDMTDILKASYDFAKENNYTYYKKMDHVGFLRHLLIRRGERTGEILVAIATSSQDEFKGEEYAQRLLNLKLEGEIVGIIHITNDNLADTITVDKKEILFGRDYFFDSLCGLEFRISTFSFFQPNTLSAEKLYEKINEFVASTKEQTVFDLYSGTGTIAQVISKSAKRVVGVEIVEEAVEKAKENAKRNNLENCSFHCGDVLKVIDDLQEVPDILVLDPPRDGIHPKALPKLINFNVNKIIYISCKATSLARDLPSFIEAGYEIKELAVVDQFAQTVHVETIALIQRVK